MKEKLNKKERNILRHTFFSSSISNNYTLYDTLSKALVASSNNKYNRLPPFPM